MSTLTFTPWETTPSRKPPIRKLNCRNGVSVVATVNAPRPSSSEIQMSFPIFRTAHGVATAPAKNPAPETSRKNASPASPFCGLVVK